MIIIGIVLRFVGLAYLCGCCSPWQSMRFRSSPALWRGLPLITAVRVRSQQSSSARSSAASPSLSDMIAFTGLRSPLIRAALARLFAVPAAVPGYPAARGLAHIAIPAEGWRDAIAVAGAAIVVATAWMRMAFSLPPDAGQGLPAGLTSPPLPASQTREA